MTEETAAAEVKAARLAKIEAQRKARREKILKGGSNRLNKITGASTAAPVETVESLKPKARIEPNPDPTTGPDLESKSGVEAKKSEKISAVDFSPTPEQKQRQDAQIKAYLESVDKQKSLKTKDKKDGNVSKISTTEGSEIKLATADEKLRSAERLRLFLLLCYSLMISATMLLPLYNPLQNKNEDEDSEFPFVQQSIIDYLHYGIESLDSTYFMNLFGAFLTFEITIIFLQMKTSLNSVFGKKPEATGFDFNKALHYFNLFRKIGSEFSYFLFFILAFVSSPLLYEEIKLLF